MPPDARGYRRAERGPARGSLRRGGEGEQGRKGAGEKGSTISFSLSPFLPFPPSSSLSTYRDIFPDRCYLLAELHHRGNDQERLDGLAARSAAHGPAAGGRGRRAFPRAPATAAQRRALRRAARLHGGHGRRTAVSQRPALPALAAGNGRALRPLSPGPGTHIGNRPADDLLARRVALRVPRGTRTAGPDAAGISDPAGLGRRGTAIRGACPTRCGD